MTALTLITRALKAANIIGMNEVAGGVEASAAKDVLNMMLDQWSLQNLLCYYQVNEVFDLVDGQGTYNIGPSANFDFNTTRPVRIDSAYVRDSSNDYPLQIISNSEFEKIMAKSQEGGYPRYLNYVGKNDLDVSGYGGDIRLWPVPSSSSWDLGLSQTKQFVSIANLSDTYNLPIGYDAAIVYNLAAELCVHYGRTVSPGIAAKAAETVYRIKAANMEYPALISDYPTSAVTRKNTFDINVG